MSDPPPAITALAQGAAVMTGVSVLAIGERKAAHAVATFVRRNAPGFAGPAEPIGHLATLGPVVGLLWAGLRYVYQRTEHGGSAVEQALQHPTHRPNHQRRPSLHRRLGHLGREGRRFVNMALTAKSITAVTGRAAQTPVRVFVGLDSAPTVDYRVSKAMDELEQLGAFDRSVLCLARRPAPATSTTSWPRRWSTLTEGDCATVSMQYSLRPSFLSLDRVYLGREQNRALLHAINGRLRAMPAHSRPRFVALGESLGAFTLQDAFLHEGTAGPGACRDPARPVPSGRRAESEWAQQWRLQPEDNDPEHRVVEVASYEEWLALPEEARKEARYILLSHHDDPITVFGPPLAVQAPTGCPTARAQPRDARRRPLAPVHDLPADHRGRAERPEVTPTVRRAGARLPRRPGPVHPARLRPARRRRPHGLASRPR